jgi:hypothetical protein
MQLCIEPSSVATNVVSPQDILNAWAIALGREALESTLHCPSKCIWARNNEEMQC